MLTAILDQAQVLEQELALLDTTVRLDLTALCPALPENTAPLQDFLFLQVFSSLTNCYIEEELQKSE